MPPTIAEIDAAFAQVWHEPAGEHAAKIAKSFARIAFRAQWIANNRGGDYSELSTQELCDFMVEYDHALTEAER